MLSERTIASGNDDEAAVAHIFKRILVRSPKDREIEMLRNYYRDALDKFLKNTEDAMSLVAVGEFEHLEVDPAKTAALMLTTQVIYNLDETITKE